MKCKNTASVYYNLLDFIIWFHVFKCETMIWSAEVDVWEIAPSFTELLKNTSVQFVKDSVKLLRPSDHFRRDSGGSCTGGVVHLESGTVIEYDWYG